jgi:hypothetical protein
MAITAPATHQDHTSSRTAVTVRKSRNPGNAMAIWWRAVRLARRQRTSGLSAAVNRPSQMTSTTGPSMRSASSTIPDTYAGLRIGTPPGRQYGRVSQPTASCTRIAPVNPSTTGRAQRPGSRPFGKYRPSTANSTRGTSQSSASAYTATVTAGVMTVVNRNHVDRHAAAMNGSAPPSMIQPSTRARRRASTTKPAIASAPPWSRYCNSSTVATDRFTRGGPYAR